MQTHLIDFHLRPYTTELNLSARMYVCMYDFDK